MSEPRVFASVVAPLVGFAQSLGIERARVLEWGRVQPSLLDDPDGFVPYEVLVRIWRRLLDTFPSLPLGPRYASFLPIEAFGIVGCLGRHAQDGHAALDALLRFSRLLDPLLSVDVAAERGVHRVRIDHEPRVVAMVEPMETLVLTLVRNSMALAPTMVRPREICFRHPRRHDDSIYVDVLGPGVPVRFNADFDGLRFDSTYLDLRPRDANPNVARYLGRYADDLLRSAGEVDGPMPDRVRAALQASLRSGDVGIEGVARDLGTSVRSLQRLLRDAGTSYARELDQVRRENATTLLRRPDLTVAEVAFMLGYAESRVFHRSFRRWTGKTPTEFRRAK